MAGPQTNLEEEDEAHGREASEMQMHMQMQGVSEAENAIRQRQGNAVQRFWKQQVTATVSHDRCQDHFGMSIFLS